jgi:CHASE3 domain sensor protein
MQVLVQSGGDLFVVCLLLALILGLVYLGIYYIREQYFDYSYDSRTIRNEKRYNKRHKR